MMDIGKERDKMTKEEALKGFNTLRAEGKTDEEIKMTLFMMFRADEFGAYEFYQLTQILGLPLNEYFLVLDIEEQKDYLRWDKENNKTIPIYFEDDEEYIYDEEDVNSTPNIKGNRYNIEQVKQQFKKWEKEDGMTKDEMAVTLYLMFHDDVISAEEYGELMDILGYDVGEEFLNATTEEQKDTSRWVELAEENVEAEINYDIIDDDLEADLNNYFFEEEE